MVNDAEKFADEDKQKRDSVESRNQAESLIYSTEKSMGELGDKLPEEDKSKITACIDQLKKSLEQDDLDAIKSDTDALVQASHKMAELLYSQQAQQPTPEATDAEPNKEDKSNDDDIVDADYEEVKK